MRSQNTDLVFGALFSFWGTEATTNFDESEISTDFCFSDMDKEDKISGL